MLIGILGLLAFSVAAALLRERAVSNASHETYGALVAITSRDRVAVNSTSQRTLSLRIRRRSIDEARLSKLVSLPSRV